MSGQDCARFSLVNRRARKLCADDDLWMELCARNFGMHREMPRPEDGWRALYRVHHQARPC